MGNVERADDKDRDHLEQGLPIRLNPKAIAGVMAAFQRAAELETGVLQIGQRARALAEHMDLAGVGRALRAFQQAVPVATVPSWLPHFQASLIPALANYRAVSDALTRLAPAGPSNISSVIERAAGAALALPRPSSPFPLAPLRKQARDAVGVLPPRERQELEPVIDELERSEEIRASAVGAASPYERVMVVLTVLMVVGMKQEILEAGMEVGRALAYLWHYASTVLAHLLQTAAS